MESIFTIIAALVILFLPGFLWSFIFFKQKLDTIERVIFSFVLSIAIVPLTVFYTNLLGLTITPISVSLQTIWIVLFAGIVILFQMQTRRSK